MFVTVDFPAASTFANSHARTPYFEFPNYFLFSFDNQHAVSLTVIRSNKIRIEGDKRSG